MHKLALKLL